MSWRFQVSKFKNAAPKIPKKEEWISNLNASRLMQSYGNHIAASTKHMVFNTQDCGVGSICILPLNAQGRSANTPCIRAHGDFVSDFEFSPFVDCLLATGSYDGMIKIWQLPDEVTSDICEASLTLPTVEHRIDIVTWHPTASSVLAVTSQQTIKIWDVDANETKIELSAADQIHSVSWKLDGSSLVTSCKDRLIRIYDPRQNKQTLEWTGHDSMRDSRVLWCGNTDWILSSGFTTSQDRALSIWDVRNTSAPLQTLSGGTSTGTLIPLYDESTGMLFVSGKGDRSIRFCEVTDAGAIKENSSDLCEQVKGLCMVPKRAVQVMECEIVRLLLLSQSNITAMPYHVPRKSYREFHSDLFPDITSNIPAMTAAEWFSGKTAQVKRVSMDPSQPQPSETKPVSKQSSRPSSAEKDQEVETRPVIGQSILRPTNNVKASKSAEPTIVIPGQSILKPVNARPEPANANLANAEQLMPDRSLLRPISQSDDNVKNESDTGDETASEVGKFESAKIAFQRLESRETMRKNGHLNGCGDENGNSAPGSGCSTPVRTASSRRFKGFRVCKFRHLEGRVLHRSTHIENLRDPSQNVTGESDGFHCNAERSAVPLKGTSGLVAVLEHGNPGRLSDLGVPCVENGCKVLDFSFDPFNDRRLVCACDDGRIRVWAVPPVNDGIERTDTEPEFIIDAHQERLYFVKYHPLARDVMTSASYDMTVKIWDMTSRTCMYELKDHTDVVFCLSWSPDGRYCVTACKDGKLRLYEPRKSTQPIREGECEKYRGGRIVWACEGKFIIYCGFSRQNNRLVTVYDADDLTKALASQEVGMTPAILVPHYDEDSSTLFLVGRGEATVHTYEVSLDAPHLFPMSPWKADSLHQALCFLTKLQCDVRQVEFARAYRLTASTLEPVSFVVPRVKAEYFQDDIFPDTRLVWQPAMTAADWFSGANTQPKRVSLRPADMRPLSEASVTDSPKPRRYEAFSATAKTDDEKKEELVSAMMSKMSAQRDSANQARSSVTDEDWDD